MKAEETRERGGVVRGKEDVVMGGIPVVFEQIRRDMAPEMIVPAGGEMAGA